VAVCSPQPRISVLFRGRGMKRCLAEGIARFDMLVGCRARQQLDGHRRPAHETIAPHATRA
jgi:hypothetical protein